MSANFLGKEQRQNSCESHMKHEKNEEVAVAIN